MNVGILNITNDALKVISLAARTCYASRKTYSEDKQEAFIKGLIKSGHETPLEFASVTFDISGVSRVLTHQLVRHRIASYCQESQRYVNQSHNTYEVPESIRKNESFRRMYLLAMFESLDCYNKLIAMGVPKEDARYLLPESMHTKITVNFNFRELRHFLKLRLDKHAQCEIRKLAGQMKDLIIAKGYGCIVEDIGE